MAWTNPANHVYATSEVVTAATLNTYVKDNLVALGLSQTQSVGITFSNVASQVATVTFSPAFSSNPIVLLTPQESANFDLVCTVTAVSTTQFSLRAVTRAGALITGNANVYWRAMVAGSPG